MSRRRGLTAIGGLLTLAMATVDGARAQASAPAPRTHLIVIAGASGEPAYGVSFHASALAIVDAARTRLGILAEDITYLGEDPARAPTRIAAISGREQVAQTLTRVAARSQPGDHVWIVLIGHGSAQGTVSRFNLPGPDLSAAEFARLLTPFAGRQLAFVNASSASGDFAQTLAAPGRAIVTATKSPLERNETRFARHFADALAAPGADVDKDGGVSLLEAFGYAKREVARAYETENRLQTEHAQLEDDGDGVATDTPGPAASDGRLAAALVLGGRGAGGAGPLVARARELEQAVVGLRARRASMDSAAYLQQLESALVELARASRAVRAAGGTR